MRRALNILMVGLLVFGIATMGFFQNAVVKESSPVWGYFFLVLTVLCGLTIYFISLFAAERLAKANSAIQELTQSTAELSKEDQISNEEAGTSSGAVEIAEKISNQLLDNVDMGLFSEDVLSKLAKQVNFAHGIFYVYNRDLDLFTPAAKYALYSDRELQSFKVGEGINGQVAKDGIPVLIDSLQDNYIQIVSGLGKSSPKAITINPVVKDKETVGLFELAYLNKPSEKELQVLNSFCQVIAAKLTSIKEVQYGDI